jgi:hypothetical protein
MFSKRFSRAGAVVLTALAWLGGDRMIGAQDRPAPKFYPDDPIRFDDDRAFDASAAKSHELSEYYDFLKNTFASPGDRADIRALNVNTIDEVPDSSWFTNRIGIRDLFGGEIARGPNPPERLDAEEWTIVRGKGPGGFHPGFRAVHSADPKQVYQLEVDPPGHPQMATGAELISTLIYHALGYHVVDVSLIRVDPLKIRIAPAATIRDASGTRKFGRGDLESILRMAARDSRGRVYMSASRFRPGRDLGRFQYHGTRPDDPNDIYPHEHRRELRANRVFAAWLAHDDSRAVNSLDMLIEENGRKYIRHYMYDFGATLGSATRFPDPVVNNHEHFIDKLPNLASLLSLGLHVPPYLRSTYGGVPPSVGFFESAAFEPTRWKPNYPNAAFENMRPDDAFWGARLVARFSDETIRTIVKQVGYDDPRATEYMTRTLIERRNKITQVWLNAVNPIVDVSLSAGGTLTFSNAAVEAKAATGSGTYRISWSRFDNQTGVHRPIGAEVETSDTRVAATAALPHDAEFVAISVRGHHPDHAAWNQPVHVYFRRLAGGWKTVGLER